jgi:methyl-accepting chemotaxis protein
MALWTIVDFTELEESNKLNQTLMDNLPVAMWMANEVGRCCSVNKEFTRLLGWEKEELLGKLASESPYVCESGLPYMKEGTLEALNKLWEKVIQKKELGVEDTPFLTKDGKIVIHRGIEVPHGKGKGRIWMSTDITDLRKREEEIESTKDYMEHVLEGLVPPIWLLDKEGNVTHINSSFEQILGYKKEECVGNSLEEFCAKIVNEKDTPIIATRVKERLLSGEIARSVPLTLITKENKEISMLYQAAPIKDIKGNIIGEVVSATDITELRKREEELSEIKAHLEGIIANIADALCVVDNEAKWLIVNPAMTRFTGYSEDELLAKKTLEQPFWQLPEAREAVRDMWRKLQAGEVVSGIEMPWVRKDDQRVIISASEQSLKDAGGNVIGRVFTARDVTELKRATHEVAQAASALSEGDLTWKVDVSGLSGDLREMGESINKSIDSLDMLIKEVAQAVGTLALGDLTWKVDVSGLSGDLREMGESINKSIDSLDMLIKEAKSAAQVVSSTSQSLGTSAEELSASANQVSGSIVQIARGVENQAQQVEEVRKATDDLRTLSRRGASEAESAAKETARASEEALMGSRAAQDAIDRTNKIFNVTSDSASVVKSLGKLIEEIGVVVEMITSIADQTNLLSLNAAIEAARAGEQGRAFAVVAGEVKRLAEESKESAKKIASMIKRIETERAKAVDSMDLGLKEVTEGKEVINRSLNALNEIARLVQEAADMSRAIFATNREQEEAIQRVGKAIQEISTVAEQNAAGAEEVSASNQEETAGVEELTATAQELASMAENLSGAVAKFRIVEMA